ncbi:hypothetical protein O3P69_010423 [Scylla paramamosain]|uniref:Uncharacterized protein n=1 Tax=Scylla paramamosain TaxID=85552 RepID=A0AAW0TU78_SCYPA
MDNRTREMERSRVNFYKCDGSDAIHVCCGMEGDNQQCLGKPSPSGITQHNTSQQPSCIPQHSSSTHHLCITTSQVSIHISPPLHVSAFHSIPPLSTFSITPHHLIPSQARMPSQQENRSVLDGFPACVKLRKLKGCCGVSARKFEPSPFLPRQLSVEFGHGAERVTPRRRCSPAHQASWGASRSSHAPQRPPSDARSGRTHLSPPMTGWHRGRGRQWAKASVQTELRHLTDGDCHVYHASTSDFLRSFALYCCRGPMNVENAAARAWTSVGVGCGIGAELGTRRHAPSNCG